MSDNPISANSSPVEPSNSSATSPMGDNDNVDGTKNEGILRTSRLNNTDKQTDTNHTSDETSKEMHEIRIKSLRKTLLYLKETEWMYRPIEKYIGQ